MFIGQLWNESMKEEYPSCSCFRNHECLKSNMRFTSYQQLVINDLAKQPKFSHNTEIPQEEPSDLASVIGMIQPLNL
jgi:hypothetical protein